MNGIAADYSVPVGEALKRLVVKLAKVGRPVMIWGPPGVGKSEAMEQAAGELAWNYCDFRALLYQPHDVSGFPYREGTRSRFTEPSFWPPSDSEERWLVNIEELPAAPPAMQTALYQFVQNRRCGEYSLPKGAAVIACGNRENDRGGVYKMLAPLASRFIHIDTTVDVGEWSRWAARADLEEEVIFFIRFRQNLLHQFDPKSKELPFPCPRTWHYVSDMLNAGFTPEELRAAVRGTVGEHAAIEFVSFLEVYKDIPDPALCLSDPKNAPIPQKIDQLLALCGSIYRMADQENMDSVVSYAARIAEERKMPDVGEFMIRQCTTRDPLLQNTKAWIKWETMYAA